jgi:Cdc6-like AAA superfamily ATPase
MSTLTQNANANQRAAEAIKNQEVIAQRKREHLVLVFVVHVIGLALFHIAYIIAAMLWWQVYSRKRVSPRIWRLLFIVGSVSGLIASSYIWGSTQNNTHRWGVVPLLYIATLVEYVRFIVWGLKKMAPETLQEQLARLQKDFEGRERRQSDAASRRNLDDTASAKGEIYLGTQLRGDMFRPESGIVQQSGLLGFSEKLFFQNMLIVGAVGSGKTTLLLRMIQQILSSTELDVYVIDGKGDEEFAQQVASLVYQQKQTQVPIFRVGGDKRGAIYNPFSGSPEAIFNRLCSLAGVHEQTGEARYYARRNMEILQIVTYAPCGVPRSFADLRQRLSREWLVDAYEGDRATVTELKAMNPKAFEELQMALRPLTRMFAPLTGEEGFKIEDTRYAVFSLGTQSAGITASEFVNMLIEDIKDAMRNRIKRQCVWIVDEFLVLGNDSVRDILTIGRSFGMGVVLAMQSIDAVDDDRTKDLMLTNCRTKILMANDKPETLIQVAGTRKAFETSIQHDEGAATGMGSSRLQDQYLIDPNEVRALHAGECFMLRQQKAAKLKVSPVRDIQPIPQAELHIQKVQPSAAAPAQQDEGLRV